MGLSIKWDITYKCNLMCDHCINGNYLNNEEDEISLEDIKKIINKIDNSIHIEYIHFLGGEPLTKKDFLDVLLFLEEKNIKFGFNSNGLLFNEKVLERIGNLKCFDEIVFSLEGPNAEINDAIRGKNVFNILINRMKLVNEFKSKNSQSAFKLCVNTVVTSQNYTYISEIISLCEENNVKNLGLLEFIESGNGLGKQLSINEKQFKDVVKTIGEYYTKNKKKVNIIPKFSRPLAKDYAEKCFKLDYPEIVHGCGAAATSLFIDNHGAIYPCDRNRNINTDKLTVIDSDFWKLWNSSTFSEPFTKYYGEDTFKYLEPCNKCKYLCEECFPCYLCVPQGTKSTMKLCKYMIEEINFRDKEEEICL